MPAYSTKYVKNKIESWKMKRQALKVRIGNYAKDFLPPDIFRELIRIKKSKL